MAGSWFAKRRADFAWLARSPSHRAPRLSEISEPSRVSGRVPMSAQERTVLDAVLAEPDADEPRFRYAEWCDRQGDPRGAFIREQLRTPEVTQIQSSDERFAPWSARDLVYRRGFIEALSLSGRAFISLGEPLFHLTPLREVRLVAIVPFLDELIQTAHLAKLHTLDLRGNGIGDADADNLLKQWPALVLLR